MWRSGGPSGWNCSSFPMRMVQPPRQTPLQQRPRQPLPHRRSLPPSPPPGSKPSSSSEGKDGQTSHHDMIQECGTLRRFLEFSGDKPVDRYERGA